MNYSILLTFDVEDWFQVENFKKCIPFSSWPKCELRVEKNVHRILDLLDSIKLSNSTDSKNVSREAPACGRQASRRWSKPTNPSNPMNPTNPSNPTNPTNPSNPTNPMNSINPSNSINPKATFFILGWLAERLPHLVREIQARGHEVASHGYDHVLCREQSAEDLKNDLLKSKKLLEDITGAPIYGYRAPGFSVNRNILSLIEGEGYLYDSSFNSFRLNKRYGQIELNGNNGNGILHKISDSFYEFPITNLKIGKQILPWGGGGYFRLIPSFLFRYGVQSILKNQGAYLFYLHPWEIDSGQPRVTGVPVPYRFRHYINISKTLDKLAHLLEKLKNCQFQACYQYLTEKIAALNNLLSQ